MSYDWINTIPNYLKYFDEEQRAIIEIIGMKNYLKLYEYFSKTRVYFSNNMNPDQEMILSLIGENNYNKLSHYFSKSGIYISSKSINTLKRVYVNQNRHIDYAEAARILNVSVKSIYNWRQSPVFRKKVISPNNYNLFEEE